MAGRIKKISTRTVVRITLISFVLALVVAWPSQNAVYFPLYVALPTLFLIIFIGVLADLVGVAVTRATESPFHARAAKKKSGAREALNLIRRADFVANFSSDMIGDLSGTLSGAMAAALVIRWGGNLHLSPTILSVVAVSLVSAITIGSKALAKNFAIRQAEWVIWTTGRTIYWLLTGYNSLKRIGAKK